MIFNVVDLSDYGLTVRKSSPSSFMPPIKTNYVEIADKAYDFRAYLKPRAINLDVLVTGTSKANLISNLDNISKLLNPVEGVKHLTLDFPDDRFYKAKLDNPIDWEIVTHKLARAELSFICPDPLGYAVDPETSSNHDIDTAEKTVDESVGGTGYVAPIYTLTAKNTLTDATIKVENLTTEEELIWVGSLAIDGTLVIDCEKWLVSKGAVADMTTVTGKFPRLKPNMINQIKVTGLYVSIAGGLNITYRDTYL